MKRQKFNESQLAVEFGLDRRTIAERLSDVAPCETKRGKGGRESRYYWLKDAVPALLGIDSSARERLAEIKIKQAELDYLERTGDLVSKEAAQSAFNQVGAESNARLGDLGHPIALEISGIEDVDTVAALIQARIDSARELLADIRIELRDPAPEAQRLNGH
jgi:phage terminase Nu1 subunit (DNA packaging protein)